MSNAINFCSEEDISSGSLSYINTGDESDSSASSYGEKGKYSENYYTQNRYASKKSSENQTLPNKIIDLNEEPYL